MGKFSRGDFYLILIQIMNSSICLLGLGLLGSSLFLSYEIQAINNFILSIAFISIFMLFCSFLGFCCIKNSPCAIMIYVLMNILFVLTILPLSFLIIFEQEEIVKFLIENIKDSEETINKAKYFINLDMDITKIVLLSYCLVFVIL
jgi:hypothetical protein